MAQDEPAFSLGIEEEYLLVDLETMALANAPDALMSDCADALEGQVSPEFLQCQIEVGTKVCADIGAARDDLRRLRQTVATCAGRHGLAPIAASCHPFADWKNQAHTDKSRYNELEQALAGVARRMLICGMHVHVGIDSADMRIDLMNQLTYFLPHLLALSANSPYWQGRDTGLASYRLTVFDNLPRTGLPPQLPSWAAYERTTGTLVDLGLIEDTTKVWWDLRPSGRFPTLETRICDVPPRLEDTLTLAALIQCVTRMLWRLSRRNQRWRLYDSFLVGENRWRAQRYGTTEGLIDYGAATLKSLPDLTAELIELVAEDASELGCELELTRIAEIANNGNGAVRQRSAYDTARNAGDDHEAALRAVVRHLVDEFREGL